MSRWSWEHPQDVDMCAGYGVLNSAKSEPMHKVGVHANENVVKKKKAESKMDISLFFLIWTAVYALVGALDSLTTWDARGEITKLTKSSVPMRVIDALTMLFAAVTLWEALKDYFPNLTGGGYGGGYGQ